MKKYVLCFIGFILLIIACTQTPTTVKSFKVDQPIQYTSEQLAVQRQKYVSNREAKLKNIREKKVPFRSPSGGFELKRVEKYQTSVKYLDDPYVYNETYLISKPFSVSATEQETLNSQNFWRVNAMRQILDHSQEDIVVNFETALEYSDGSEISNEFFKFDTTYFYTYTETYAFDKYTDVRKDGKLFISSSPDAQQALDIDGQLHYRIRLYSSSGVSIVAAGRLDSGSPPIDLVEKHNLSPNIYYTEIFIVKPVTAGTQTMGSRKSIYLNEIIPIQRSDVYIDGKLIGPRYFSANHSRCPREVKYQAVRHPNIHALNPTAVETRVDIYSFPDWNYLGSLPEAGIGNYTFTWDGTLPVGFYRDNGGYELDPGHGLTTLPHGWYYLHLLHRYKRDVGGSVYDSVDQKMVFWGDETNIPEDACQPEPSPPPGGDGDSGEFCHQSTSAGGSVSLSCVKCPGGRLLFKNKIPVSCQSEHQTDEAQFMFNPSDGDFSIESVSQKVPYAQFRDVDNSNCRLVE